MESTAAVRTHKRVYQACEPCREKKVRCELGLVDHPTKPPCARCRRESRECFFAAKRARKASAIREEKQGNQLKKRRATSPPPTTTAQQSTSSRPQFTAYLSPSASAPNSVPAVEAAQGQTLSSTGNGRATAALLRGHPRTYHDALTLLSEACDHCDHRKTSHNTPSRPADSRNNDVSSPARTRSPIAINNSSNPETLQALKTWSTVRFVRGGLFTAEEALDMVDHFYHFQAPFSPIVPERFKEHSQHTALIEEEPILTVTLLMIGSRYRKWTGPGAGSRPCIVHDRLWRYLQGMISRLFWSEDNFVGEFTALADSFPGMDSNNHSRPGIWSNGFRTLGTCEALLMLLDWHPQALHFPPVDEDTTSIVIPESKTPRRQAASSSYCGPGSGHDWLARSDRMCRSMLSAASMLATEIGVFDEEDTSANHGLEGGNPAWEMPSDRKRVYRLRRLIWVYSTQQPGRPSWKILTPAPSWLGPGMEKDDTTECWFRVATLMKQANDLLFPSQKHTNEIIRNGEHSKILQEFQPILQEWSITFDQTKLTKQMRSILTIEYAYVRLCTFSVALQAVINRRYYDGAGQDMGPPVNSSGTLHREEEHLTETVKAAQTILRTVLDDFLPDGCIKYIPVRTYSRILGATLFLLKSCAAGITEIDIPTSLHLVNRIAIGLRSSIVDDTHLGARWGDLLLRLSGGLQSRLVQPQNPTKTRHLAPDMTRPTDQTPFPDSSTPYNPSQPSVMRSTGSNEPLQPRTHFEPNDFMDIYSASMDSGRYGHNSEAFTMWWDLLHPSQTTSSSEIPWYPNLGNLDGSEPAFHDGEVQHGSSGYSGNLY